MPASSPSFHRSIPPPPLSLPTPPPLFHYTPPPPPPPPPPYMTLHIVVTLYALYLPSSVDSDSAQKVLCHRQPQEILII